MQLSHDSIYSTSIDYVRQVVNIALLLNGATQSEITAVAEWGDPVRNYCVAEWGEFVNGAYNSQIPECL